MMYAEITQVVYTFIYPFFFQATLKQCFSTTFMLTDAVTFKCKQIIEMFINKIMVGNYQCYDTSQAFSQATLKQCF